MPPVVIVCSANGIQLVWMLFLDYLLPNAFSIGTPELVGLGLVLAFLVILPKLLCHL